MNPDHTIQFGTLSPDGTLTNQRSIKQADIGRCPNVIFVADHYREDGSCKCNSRSHRDMMIAEWEYTEDSFTEPTTQP